MNILIIGEFSGFAKHLKSGFEKLGHRVVVFLNGDGWKGFQPTGEDLFYRNKAWKVFGVTIRGTGRIDSIFENLRIQRELDRLFPEGVDIIFCVNYSFLSANPGQCGVSLGYISRSIKRGAKLIMSECGRSMAGKYSHEVFYNRIGYQDTPLEDRRYSFLLEHSKVIVPTVYGYYTDLITYARCHPYDTTKVAHSVPLPINIDDKMSFQSCVGRKIVVFHGIIRPAAKGTSFIQEAMMKLQKEMPDRVECICQGGIPYDDYVKLFERMDILIDQCALEGYWGMNATIGAMKGKCVLVSCGNKNQEHMNINDIPFVNIRADVDDIYNTLKELVMHPERIDRIKKEGRMFVEKYCESSVVAKKYLDLVN